MPHLQTYSVVLFVHIASGAALIGSSLVGQPIRRLIADASSPAELGTALRLARRTARLNPLLAILLLATALYLGSFGWWRQPWFLVAVTGWWVNFLLAHLVVVRIARAIGTTAFAQGEGLGPRVNRLRRSAAWTASARVMLGVDFSLLFLMVTKPGLAGSLAVVALAVMAATIPGLVHLRRRPGAESDGNHGRDRIGPAMGEPMA